MRDLKRKFKNKATLLQDERGSAIVIALLTLVTLTIIGISASTTSRIETLITTSNVLYKQAFYYADGGTEIARELLEECLSCMGGFPSSSLTDEELIFRDETDITSTKIRVTDPAFALQERDDFLDTNGKIVIDFTGDRDIWFVGPEYELNDDNATPHTNIVAFGDTELGIGSAIQMAAGYEGIGKGAGGGGGQILYDIHSRHEYRGRASTSYVMVEHLHMIGQEGECQY